MKGFDAIIGNPPWVLYAGKGKAPIEPAEEETLKMLFGRAGRTLSTHGAFACLGGRLTRPRGRVGLVLPTSMADASRYADTRAAHDALCAVETGLPDFGESAFIGVFQPSFGLVSTRRDRVLDEDAPAGDAWTLHRPGVDTRVRALLAKLDAFPKLPGDLFGERGYRSSQGHEGTMFRKLHSPAPPFTAALYEGTSVREFELLAPTAYGDPENLDELAKTEKWSGVAVFIRQTARYPSACLSARAPFRNSILAGFSVGVFTPGFLLAYLNSSAIRWYHFHAQRDAQQGMPQVKIGHLRSLPAPCGAVAELAALGDRLGARGSGITDSERTDLDRVVGDALALDEGERELVAAWASANPPPVGRTSRSASTDGP